MAKIITPQITFQIYPHSSESPEYMAKRILARIQYHDWDVIEENELCTGKADFIFEKNNERREIFVNKISTYPQDIITFVENLIQQKQSKFKIDIVYESDQFRIN